MGNRKYFVEEESKLMDDISEKKYLDVLKILADRGWTVRDYRCYSNYVLKNPDIKSHYICFLFCKKDRGFFVEFTREGDGNDYCSSSTMYAAEKKLDQKFIEDTFNSYIDPDFKIVSFNNDKNV